MSQTVSRGGWPRDPERVGDGVWVWTHGTTGLRLEIRQCGGTHLDAYDPTSPNREMFFRAVVRPPAEKGDAALYSLVPHAQPQKETAFTAVQNYIRRHPDGVPTTFDPMDHQWEPARWDVEFEEVSL